MAVWTPSKDHHRQIAEAWVDAKTSVAEADAKRIPLEEFRALPDAERHRQWHKTWTPYRFEADGRAWDRLLRELANGHWHRFNDLRKLMVEAGPLNWRHAATLLYTGVKAEALEEFRWGGYRSWESRRIRLREDCPARLLARKDANTA